MSRHARKHRQDGHQVKSVAEGYRQRVKRRTGESRRSECCEARGSAPCRADGDAEGQAANYRESAERAELRAEQIRHILNERGISIIQYVLCRSFGLHVDKLCRGYSGESLRLQVSAALARWSSYGCSPKILSEICEQVFGLGSGRHP